MKPLLIGQAPGPNTDPEFPLFPLPSTSAGGRLQKIMDLQRGEYLRTFDRVNLLYKFPGKVGGEDRFPMSQARLAARAMLSVLSGRTVILVGRNVSNAFPDPVCSLGFHQWLDFEMRNGHEKKPYRFALVPHPSGRSRWYNDAENMRQARTFWEQFLREGPCAQGSVAQ